MRSEVERKIAVLWKLEGLSYNEIASRLHVSRNVAINLCLYKISNKKSKTGPKLKINKRAQLRIKRKIAHFQSVGEEVNASKIIRVRIKCFHQHSTKKYKKIPYGI